MADRFTAWRANAFSLCGGFDYFSSTARALLAITARCAFVIGQYSEFAWEVSLFSTNKIVAFRLSTALCQALRLTL